MKNLFCLLFLLINSILNAQFADLIKDKNIAWIGESTIDVRLDVLQDQEMEKVYELSKYFIFGGLTLLKIQESKEINAEEGFDFFTKTLINAEFNKFITIYSDSLCTQATDMLSVIRRNDTLTTYDPITQETKHSIATCAPPISQSYLYRIRLIISYNSETNKWDAKVLTIAPLEIVRDEEGKFVTWKPLFWVKVENGKVDINSSDITWVVRTRSTNNHSLVQLNAVKTFKKNKVNMPMLHFLGAAKINAQITLYKANDWREKELVSFEEKQSSFKNFDTNKINEIGIVQEWAWDNKRKIILVKFLGMTPVERKYNDADEYLGNFPLFYQRSED